MISIILLDGDEETAIEDSVIQDLYFSIDSDFMLYVDGPEVTIPGGTPFIVEIVGIIGALVHEDTYISV